MDNRSTYGSNLFHAGVGGLAGLLILHPLAMAFAGSGAGGSREGLSAAFAAAVHPSMIPMAVVFAVTGVALFVPSAAVQKGTNSLHRPGVAATAEPPSFRRMCMGCKAIPQRTVGDHEVWLPLEQSLLQTDNLVFSHGLCPRCKDSFLREAKCTPHDHSNAPAASHLIGRR